MSVLGLLLYFVFQVEKYHKIILLQILAVHINAQSYGVICSFIMGISFSAASSIIRTEMRISVCSTQIQSFLQNRKKKSLRASSHHRAAAGRLCRYEVIEGFQLLGRITGFEMIARFNRPLKQEATQPPRARTLLSLPIDLLLPLPTDLFTFISNCHVCVSATHFCTSCLFKL